MREAFEDWYSKRGDLFRGIEKNVLWIIFADGYHRGRKSGVAALSSPPDLTLP